MGNEKLLEKCVTLILEYFKLEDSLATQDWIKGRKSQIRDELRLLRDTLKEKERLY